MRKEFAARAAAAPEPADQAMLPLAPEVMAAHSTNDRERDAAVQAIAYALAPMHRVADTSANIEVCHPLQMAPPPPLSADGTTASTGEALAWRCALLRVRCSLTTFVPRRFVIPRIWRRLSAAKPAPSEPTRGMAPPNHTSTLRVPSTLLCIQACIS